MTPSRWMCDERSIGSRCWVGQTALAAGRQGRVHVSADAARSIAECKRDQDAPRPFFSAGVVHRTKANQRFLYAIYNLEICIGWVAIARGFPAANEALIDEFRILPNFAHGSIARDALDFVEDEVADWLEVESLVFERRGTAADPRMSWHDGYAYWQHRHRLARVISRLAKQFNGAPCQGAGRGQAARRCT